MKELERGCLQLPERKKSAKKARTVTLTKKEAPEVSILNTFNRSNSPHYNHSKLPSVGDIIMATASDMDHPLARKEMIDPSYLMFGVVLKFTSVSTAATPTIQVEEERLIVNWLPVEDANKYYHIEAAHPFMVTVIRKKRT